MSAPSVFHAQGFSIGVKLRLSPTMRHEWQARSIGSVITALDGYGGEDFVMVDAAVASEIAADCAFHADPKAIDASPGERAAYRALGAAIAKAIGGAA